MPLPWKKTRVNRISQFVADLQSPKRGGSFVVQTGFPTSLIDLFVKNCDHLRKPSKKHKNKKKNKDNRVENPANDRITANSELGPSNFAILEQPSLAKVEDLSPEEGDHVVEAGGFETHVENLVVVGEERVNGNWNAVLLAVSKMFVVVILTLSTTKLAVGITLSAFLLLLLEYAGKHLACFLRPCSTAKSVLINLCQRASAFLLFLIGFNESEDVKGVILREKDGNVVFDLVDSRSESESLIEEAQILEPNKRIKLIELLGEDDVKERVVDKGSAGDKTLVELLAMDGENRRVMGTRRVLSADKTAGEVSLVKLLGADYEKSKGMRNSKIKSQLIKKFVPKKLRRKGKKNATEPELRPFVSSEYSSYMVDHDKVEEFEEQVDHKDVKLEEQKSHSGSASSLNAEQKSKIQETDGVSDHGEGSFAVGETALTVESSGEGNFGYLMLFLIVLAGLFRGRIVALMLTITFCFLMRLIKTLRRLVKKCP